MNFILISAIVALFYVFVWAPMCLDQITKYYTNDRRWHARFWILLGGPIFWACALYIYVTDREI